MSTYPTATGLAFSATPLALPHVAELAPRRFTVDEYHRMIDSAILTENDRVQLVDGMIVEMPPIGPEHITSNSLAGEAIRACLPAGWIVRIQGPVTLDRSEPEPDVVVARGTLRNYAKRHPAAADVSLVVEIADATLAFDRTQKAAQYAAAGIPEYWIVNLVDRQLEVHRDPQTAATGAEYRVREIVDALRTVSLNIDDRQAALLQVADLLP